MVKYYKKEILNPLVLSCFIVAIVFYTGLIPIKNKNCFRSLVGFKNLVEVSGIVDSNPVKTAKGKHYKLNLKVSSVKDKKGAVYNAKGIIQVLVPYSQVEAHFPGKLFTEIKNNKYIPCEQGSVLSIKGKALEDTFFLAKSIKTSEQKNNKFFNKVLKIRALFRIHFRRLMFAWENAGGLLLALLTGIREYTEKNVTTAFCNAGLSHILALSGMHLNLFSNIAQKTSEKFLSLRKTMFVKLSAIIFFVFFAGFSPSLFRAFLCTLITYLVLFLKIKNFKMISVLALSFLIHISIKPTDLFEVAFILSYSSLLGILIFSDFFNLHLSSFIPNYLCNALSASISAQIFTIPISLKIFGTFTPIGIISTVIVSPLISIFIYFGIFMIILCLIFPIFVSPAAFFLKILYTLIVCIVSFFAQFPIFKLEGI